MHINRDLKSNEFLQAFEQIEDENKVFSVFTRKLNKML